MTEDTRPVKSWSNRGDLYVPMDVNFDEHPAILEASIEAEAVYQRALRLSKRLMSDGFIATAQGRRLTCDLDEGLDAFHELVALRLCSEVEGGWMIDGYLERNPSKADVQSRRDAEASRKAAWRETRKTATNRPNGRDADVPQDASSRDALQDNSTQDRDKTETESLEGLPPVTEGRFGVGSPQGRASLAEHYVECYRQEHAMHGPTLSWKQRLCEQLAQHPDIPYADMELIVGWMGKDGKDPKHLPLVVSDFYKDRQAGVV